MTSDYCGPRTKFLMESWDIPSLDEVLALKRSPEWARLPEDEKEMYNIMEECMSHSGSLNANGDSVYDSVVVKPVNLHGTFG